MTNIKILSESLINQIAAGEVIERPSSIVKELIENSIDAGACNIVIEIENGGKKFIKVTDNGCGMTREDLELSLQRHATSKISNESDLWKIATMGFRGEALASISSVSQLSIRSKTKDDLGGTEINCDGGEIKNIKDFGMNDGTQIEIRSLFFNTPAREKYLKKDSTELSNITSMVNTIALANPSISFKLVHNGRVISDLQKSSDLKSRIRDIFGKATSDAMLPLFYGGTDLGIDGFVGKPAISRSTNQHQYFFVNGRPIQHFALANGIKRAFHSMLMENKKPVFVINIKIDPALIDVNVHPRKLEIRFEDQQSIVQKMYGCVKAALEKNDLTPKAITESTRYMSDSFPKDDRPSPRATSMGFREPSGAYRPAENPKDAIEFSKSMMQEREQADLNSEENKLRPISQIANSYIVAQNSDGLVLIDQHAAHERVRYEELMNQLENENKSVQPLLVPLQIEFTQNESQILSESMGVFEDLGFEIEKFSGSTFIVNAVPAFLAKEDMDTVVKGVLDDIMEEKTPTKLQGRVETILTYMSCRSAIKFGQRLSLSEMEALINQMEKLTRPYTCPHGRPSMVALTLSELEKMFGRK